MVSGTRDKPQIQDLTPGVYVKSNEAIGEERDIDENRITRGVLALPAFTNYANGVLDKLKQASGFQQVPGKVLIVANDQMDAGATADGNVFISSGYLRELKNEDQLAALLAHELAHVLMHDPDDEEARQHRGIREVEAESVALMIGAAHGMDTTAYTIPYISGWAGTVKDKDPAEVVQATGERVRKTAGAILDALDTVQVGTGVFLLAFLGLLPFYGRFEQEGRTWLLWMCLTGVGLGLLGMEYCKRRRAVRTERDEQRQDDRASGVE